MMDSNVMNESRVVYLESGRILCNTDLLRVLSLCTVAGKHCEFSHKQTAVISTDKRIQ